MWGAIAELIHKAGAALSGMSSAGSFAGSGGGMSGVGNTGTSVAGITSAGTGQFGGGGGATSFGMGSIHSADTASGIGGMGVEGIGATSGFGGSGGLDWKALGKFAGQLNSNTNSNMSQPRNLNFVNSLRQQILSEMERKKELEKSAPDSKLKHLKVRTLRDFGPNR